MGYARWENFQTAIHRAMESCEATGHTVSDHFRGVTKMVELGSGFLREIDDVMLTRYLIAQNGDSRNPEIAFAQYYFAVQTRKQELIEDAGTNGGARSVEGIGKSVVTKLDDAGFGRIRSEGDRALFDGYTAQAMKDNTVS